MDEPTAVRLLGEHSLRALGTVDSSDGTGSGTVRTFMVAVATHSFDPGSACHLVVYEQGGAKVWMKGDGAGVGEDLKNKGCIDEALSCARILCNGIGFFDADDDALGGTHCHPQPTTTHRPPPPLPPPPAQHDLNLAEYDTNIKFRDGDDEMQFRVRKRVSDPEGNSTRKQQLAVKLQLQVGTTTPQEFALILQRSHIFARLPMMFLPTVSPPPPPSLSLSLQTTEPQSVVLAVATAAARSMADSNAREREQRRVARQLESANEQFRAGMQLAVEVKNRLEDKMLYQFMVRRVLVLKKI